MLVTLFNPLFSTMMLCHVYAQKLEDLAGSTLLQTVDKFALNNHNVSHPIMSNNIGMHCVYNRT